MTATTHFPRPDGAQCPAYVAEPSTPRAGVVLLQEWWGLNPQIEGMADRLAQAGFLVVVPDLFRGKLAKDADEASHLMDGLDFADAAEQDVRGAVQFLKQRVSRVGVGGFCMGGALTLLAAARVAEVDAGVCFYGIPPEGAADFTKLRVPLQLHFGGRDGWCTPARVDALEQQLLQAPAPFELHRYDADHAFMNERRPEVYDAGCAELAWERTLDFLRRTLTTAS